MDPNLKTIAASVSSSNTSLRDANVVMRLALNERFIEGLRGYAVFAVSIDGLIMTWNPGAQKTFGYAEAEIVGTPFERIFTLEDVQSGAPGNELREALTGAPTHHDRWHVRSDGTRFWGTNSVEPIFDRNHVLLGFAKVVRDITETHLAAQAVLDSEQRLRMLIESVGDTAIFSLDLRSCIQTWNAGAEALFGYARDEIVGRPFAYLFSADEASAGYAANELEKSLLAGKSNVERWLQRSNGSRFLAAGKVSQLTLGADRAPRGFVVVLHDVTGQHAVTEELRRRAEFDELTDLPNRRTFNEHLHRAISLMRRRAQTIFAVLFIDLDYFKAVNDEHGHIVADRLLVVIARRFETCVRAGDVVARIGGDEFAILLNAINGLDDAIEAAERIRLQMIAPVTIDELEVGVSVSIGIAVGRKDYERPDDVLRDADAAMYAAKLDGRAKAVVFNPQSREQRSDLGESLYRALERNELRVVYQPIVSLNSALVVGFEALVRWEHPERGRLLPQQFIPHAEQSELILAVDRWVLTESCRQLAAWRLTGLDANITMSVNISGREFSRGDFLTDLLRILGATGVPAANLRIELTESVIIEQSGRAQAMLAAIRELGVLLDVDDFGTGFSSLGSLQHTQVDALKIDSSFVSRMHARIGATLVETVIVLARGLGIEVIAEGIETLEQAQRLRQLGCAFGQGQLFAKPLNAESAHTFAVTRNCGAAL